MYIKGLHKHRSLPLGIPTFKVGIPIFKLGILTFEVG